MEFGGHFCGVSRVAEKIVITLVGGKGQVKFGRPSGAVVIEEGETLDEIKEWSFGSRSTKL